MWNKYEAAVVARKSLVDQETGFPIDKIDGIDGTECPCQIPLSAQAQAELEHNRRLDHQMVEMGRVVGGSSVKMDLPCHVREADEQND